MCHSSSHRLIYKPFWYAHYWEWSLNFLSWTFLICRLRLYPGTHRNDKALIKTNWSTHLPLWSWQGKFQLPDSSEPDPDQLPDPELLHSGDSLESWCQLWYGGLPPRCGGPKSWCGGPKSWCGGPYSLCGGPNLWPLLPHAWPGVVRNTATPTVDKKCVSI